MDAAAAPAAPAVAAAASAASALPLPEPVLVAALAVLLLLHLVAAGVGVGAALLTLVYELRGTVRRELDGVARALAGLTVPALGVAVALGAGPLILLKLLHPLQLGGATALAGPFWVLALVLVLAAVLLAALHRRSWDALAAHQGLHVALIAASCALLLTLVLMCSAVANLMLAPGLWRQVEHFGFASALTLPGVLPQALVFVLAALAVAGLALARLAGRPAAAATLDADEAKGHGYAVALGAGGLLLLASLLALLTLPAPGASGRVVIAAAAAALFALPALWWMWCEAAHPTPGAGVRHGAIAGSFALTLLFLVTGAVVHRGEALASPQERQRQQAEWFEGRVVPARLLAALTKVESGALVAKPGGADAAPSKPAGDLALGEAVFKKSCFLCHDVATRKIGPPLLEAAALYAGNPDGIVAWAKKPTPVAKRAKEGYPPMLPIVLPDNELKAVAAWILALPGQQKK